MIRIRRPVVRDFPNRYRVRLTHTAMQIQATLRRSTRWVWSTIERAVRAQRGALAVACVVLMSLAFRLHVSSVCSLWLDEVSTHLDALKSWPSVLHGPSPQHPPLMYVLVKIAIRFLGTSETGVRSVSIFFGCLLLLAVYELCLQLGLTLWRSVIVVSTLAMSPFFIRHATEARQYAILAAFCTLATTRALRLLRGPVRTRDLLGLALNAVAAAATHYFGLAYALTLLGSGAIGVVQHWKETATPRRLAALGALPVSLVPLGYLTVRASALGRTYAVGAIDTSAGHAFNSDLLQSILDNFSFLSTQVWSSVLQPGLTLVGLVLLTRRLRGVARALPLGLGVAPCVASLFISGQHFIAARYLAPSAVFYHLGACIALFAAVDRIQLLLAWGKWPRLLAPLVGGLMLISLLAARIREYPDGFGAGAEDYRGLQRYFRAELARNTALVAYPGPYAELLLHREYDVGPRLISLEKFRLLPGIHRYLVVLVHASAERRAEAGVLVARNLGISAQALSSLPLVPLPHSTYQSAVTAYLIVPPSDWVPPPPRKGGRHRKGARLRHT